MIAMEMIPPEGVAIALAQNANLQPFNLTCVTPFPELLEGLPIPLMKEHRI